MHTKLTLSLETSTIEQAKRYARMHQKSVSALVEAYFRSLTGKETGQPAETPPITRELAGSLKGLKIGDLKAERSEYLSKKFVK